MEIRRLDDGEEERLLDLLDQWPFRDGTSGREFFRRYVELDPTFASANVWVAESRRKLRSCVQVFPRRLHFRGRELSCGGIGSVFTQRRFRRRGLAAALLERAVADIRDRGFDLSLLFAERLAWYRRLGWQSLQRATLTLVPPGEAGPTTASRVVSAFDRERDLAAIADLHHRFCARRRGPVARDAAMWRSSLEVAGNPDELFLIARRDGALTAYARLMRLGRRPVVSEWAAAPRRQSDLAAVLLELRRRAKELAGTKAPQQRLYLPAAEPALRRVLERLGWRTRDGEDHGLMIRWLRGPRGGRPMGSDGSFLFFPADRF